MNRWLKPLLAASDYGAALTRLREFKQREMLRIAGRDLARLGKLAEILQEISDVADVCLDAVWQVCHQQLTGRHGQPWHQDADGRWQPTAGCVLGMGKLGGQELNYSSDVDVLFVYSEEGSVFKEPPEDSKGFGECPFPDGSFDTAVATFCFCSVSDPAAALAELHRVLVPGGRLLAIEHVHLSWQPGRRLQSLAAPAWASVAAGCRLDRDTVAAVREAGFDVLEVRRHVLGVDRGACRRQAVRVARASRS